MVTNTSEGYEAQISLRPVTQDNWRQVARLIVSETQREFVAEPCYYLSLCCYGKDWQPLAIYLGEQVIGFMMWTIDPADESCWFGGIMVDLSMQGRGYGQQAIQTAITKFHNEHGRRNFALSYNPANLPAKYLYRKLGFTETDEWEEDEIVARLTLTK
jgi:diamine N-acetyltransferase